MRLMRKPTPGELRDRLDALGVTVAAKRDEAVKARKESGIEEIWMDCEEAYLGIDDANRHEFANARWAKPTSLQGPLTTYTNQVDDTRSTAFVRLTSRYVDFASAKISEIALPIDDKAFSFDATPVPDMVMQQASPEQQAQIQHLQTAARAAAKRAEQRIYDWMIEGRHANEMRKVIHDSARIGVGVLKGPIPDIRKAQAVSKQGNMVALEIIEKLAPVTQWVDPWNLFPAPGCGEQIKDGDYILERDYISAKKLRSLKRRQGWMAEQIDKVIQEGPGKCFADGGPHNDDKSKKHRFERWQFYGVLTRDELEAANVKVQDGCSTAFAIVTLINDSVVRAVLNPLDSGEFPYHAFAWSRRAGHWAGVGVGEQVSMPQRMVNASTRAVLENAGVSAGVQIVLDHGSVQPADKSWSITRNKVWLKSPDTVIDDVRKAFTVFQIPNVQAQLMPIIEYGMRLAEEHSSIPLVSMGQYAQQASPQTYGQAELQNSNAHTLLRDKGHALDDSITEPVVKLFYEWLLLDPDVPSDEKGDFEINAHGTIAMVERAVQEMTLTMALQMSLNPAFGASSERAFELWLRSKRIDPRDIKLNDEEKAQRAQMPPPEAPAVTAAKLREQGAMQREQIRGQVAIKKMQMDTDRDRAYVQELRERAQNDAMARIEELRLKRELAMLDYANKHNMQVQDIKAHLAETAAKLRTQRELAAFGAKQVLTPPTEPPGRAAPGHAFEQ